MRRLPALALVVLVGCTEEVSPCDINEELFGSGTVDVNTAVSWGDVDQPSNVTRVNQSVQGCIATLRDYGQSYTGDLEMSCTAGPTTTYFATDFNPEVWDLGMVANSVVRFSGPAGYCETRINDPRAVKVTTIESVGTRDSEGVSADYKRRYRLDVDTTLIEAASFGCNPTKFIRFSTEVSQDASSYRFRSVGPSLCDG